MPYKQPNRRNSINPRDIIGNNIAGGGVSVVGGNAGSGGTGRTLLAQYTNNGNQSVNLPIAVQTNAAINLATATQSNPFVSSTAPFVITASADATYYIECEVTFTPSANSERYVLALQSGTTTSKADAKVTFAAVKRGTSWRMYIEGVVDMLQNDELRLILRAYNKGVSAETLTITAASVWVYSG